MSVSSEEKEVNKSNEPVVEEEVSVVDNSDKLANESKNSDIDIEI